MSEIVAFIDLHYWAFYWAYAFTQSIFVVRIKNLSSLPRFTEGEAFFAWIGFALIAPLMTAAALYICAAFMITFLAGGSADEQAREERAIQDRLIATRMTKDVLDKVMK